MYKNQHLVIGLLILCFIENSFANSEVLKKKIDDFAWSLGKNFSISAFGPLTINDDIELFVQQHNKEYLQAREHNLKIWQTTKINTSGFQQLKSEAINQYSENLSQSSFPNLDKHNFAQYYWKILSVESMTNLLATRSHSLLKEPPLEYSYGKIGFLIEKNYLFGMHHQTVPLKNNEWEVWSYGYGLAYKYRWDLRNNIVSDFSIWINTTDEKTFGKGK